MSPVRVWWVGWNADHLGSGRGTPCVPPSRSEPSPLPGRSGLRTGGEWSFRVWSLRSLFGQALTYLLSDIHHISEGCVRPIRSAADKCSVPHTHNTFGDRIFTAASPCVWSNVPPLFTSTGPQLRSVQALAENTR